MINSIFNPDLSLKSDHFLHKPLCCYRLEKLKKPKIYSTVLTENENLESLLKSRSFHTCIH